MQTVKKSAPQLDDIVPYDPKYIPARVMNSANENPRDVDADVKQEILDAIAKVPFNRYPDPLANELRDMIAEANGLARENVLLGNGGDELLFNTALTWGGPGRTFMNIPPTFSVYVNNAQLTNTAIVDVPRKADFSLDEEAILACVDVGDIDFVILTSPNNPTGDVAPEEFVERLLDATDALVMIDEAYYEFSRKTVVPLLARHENLVILRTFSKAYSLAGVRLGYILANAGVIREYMKVRQPYSVDAVSQAIGKVVFTHRDRFEARVDEIIAERGRMMAALSEMDGVEAFPSESNYILVRMDGADEVWQKLFDRGILIRDFSHAARLENCLRVSVGTPEENDAFLQALGEIAGGK